VGEGDVAVEKCANSAGVERAEGCGTQLLWLCGR
jgi:hypothetical protein